MGHHHGGLIDPSNFPARAADLDVSRIEQTATNLGRVGRAVEDGTVQVDASWSRLTGCYEAPEQEQVYGLMAPAVTSAVAVRTALARAAGHLDGYASTLAALKPRLAAFEKRAAAFRARVVDGVWVDASSAKGASFGDHLTWAFDWVPGVDERRVKVAWYEDAHTVATNTDLLDEYAALLAEISSAAAECANGVGSLVSGATTTASEAVPAAAFTAADGDPMPWGSPGTEDRNCRESVGHGGYAFGKALVQGAGSLVLGYNPGTGHFWDGFTYGQTWTGIGDLALSYALLKDPGTFARAYAGVGGKDAREAAFMKDRAMTLGGAIGSLAGYDIAAKDGWHKWHEDGWATGTETVLNVGSFFIPGAEAGGALKGASLGSKVVRLAEVGADFAMQGGSWVVRGGVRIAAGLRDALLHIHLDDLAGTVRAGEVLDATTAGARLNPTALISAIDDIPAAHTTPEHVSTDPHAAADHAPRGEDGSDSKVQTPAWQGGQHGRVYAMADGSEHLTQYAPEQVSPHVTEQVILDALTDRDLFEFHGQQPWTRDDLVARVMTPLGDLTPGEIGVLREIADRLPPPAPGDPIQKVVTPTQLNRILSGVTDRLGGSVARLEDVADLSSVKRLHDALRLDYAGSPFPELDSYHAIRWRAPDDVLVSRHSILGGDASTDHWTDPYTGNGFLKSPDLIPEYRIVEDAKGNIPLIPLGAEIWEFTREGTQRLAAVHNINGWIRVAP
jgi:hypothetical protein